MRLLQYTILLLLFSVTVNQALAQNKYLDSLQQLLLRNNLPDTTRMEVLINIGNAIVRDDKAGAREKYQATYAMAQKNRQPYYMAMALSGMGGLFHNEEYDSAMHYYLLADSLYGLAFSQTAKESRATNKASIAELERGKGLYESAIKIYLEAIGIIEKSTAENKWLILGILYSNVGSVYHDLKQFSKSLEYDLKALEAYKIKNTDPMYVAISELWVAGDYKDLNQLDKTEAHIQNAEKIARKLQSTDLLYRVQNAWGSYYQKIADYPKAIASYQMALVYAKKNENLFHEMNCNRMLGFIYRDMKRYKESIGFMQKALRQTRTLKEKLLEIELLKALALAQSDLGNYKEAVDYYKDYVWLSDSLKADEVKRSINEIENKYQAAKKQDSILTLQRNNQMQSIQLRQKQTVNIALIAGCVLLLLLAVLAYRNFKNKNRLLSQSEALRLQQLSEWEKEKKLLAAQSLMKGQEEERSRLARDLHDGVGGLLSGLKLSMSTMKGNVYLSEEHARSFEKVLVQLDQSINELRRVSHNMMPEALIKYGLKEALENYCESLNLSGKLNVKLQIYGMEQRMNQDVEIVIYRIVQELLNNIIKHAAAGNVLIQLVREAERFSLTVEDDGKGFDVNEVREGAGLANIKARTNYLNGTLDIDSRRGEGTSVHVEGSCI